MRHLTWGAESYVFPFGKAHYSTEPGPKDIRGCYGTHDAQLVSQQFDAGAIGENPPSGKSISGRMLVSRLQTL
jgi:hypothetical protein